MKFKSAFAAIAATTALSGAVFLSAGQVQACIFSEKGGITTFDSSSIAPTTTQADLGNLNKLGILGASFVILGGFLAGGVLLKRRFDRAAPLAEAAEALSDQQVEPLFEPSEFAIEIPPAVLKSLRAKASESDVNSVQ